MFGISFPGRKFKLKGVITSYENGIQVIRTESSEREFKHIQCMGFSLIKCPKCKVKPFQNSLMVVGRACEHVKVGTRVVMEHRVRLAEDRKTVVQGYWTGKPDL